MISLTSRESRCPILTSPIFSNVLLPAISPFWFSGQYAEQMLCWWREDSISTRGIRLLRYATVIYDLARWLLVSLVSQNHAVLNARSSDEDDGCGSGADNKCCGRNQPGVQDRGYYGSQRSHQFSWFCGAEPFVRGQRRKVIGKTSNWITLNYYKERSESLEEIWS